MVSDTSEIEKFSYEILLYVYGNIKPKGEIR